jgi:transposase-like protein
MVQKKRQQRSADLKAAIVLEVLTGKLSVPAAARKYKIKDAVIYKWRNDAIEKMPMLFSDKSTDVEAEAKLDDLKRLIGQQAIEIEALKKAGRWLSRLSRPNDES